MKCFPILQVRTWRGSPVVQEVCRVLGSQAPSFSLCLIIYRIWEILIIGFGPQRLESLESFVGRLCIWLRSGHGGANELVLG